MNGAVALVWGLAALVEGMLLGYVLRGRHAAPVPVEPDDDPEAAEDNAWWAATA